VKTALFVPLDQRIRNVPASISSLKLSLCGFVFVSPTQDAAVAVQMTRPLPFSVWS
jgi:hypothetical protein